MHRSTSHQAGFSASVIIIAIVALAVIGGVGFAIFNKASDEKTAATTPVDSTTPKQEMPQPSGKPETPADPYAGMKQYTNARYGLSFYYPQEWRVEERDPQLTMDSERTQLSVWLVDIDAKADADTAIVSVVSRPLDEITRSVDDDLDRFVDKSSNRRVTAKIDNRSAVKYSIKQPNNVFRERYYIGAGERTYSVTTIDERLNLDRDRNYTQKYNSVVQSLQIR